MYFITTVEKNTTRTVGYFSNIEDAINTVKTNKYDIWENCYTYAVIENVPEGLYQYDEHPLWFKFNTNTRKYESIANPPEFAKSETGFSIG